MSGMEITKEGDKRMSESRSILYQAHSLAMGSYIEQEATKQDQWREQSWWQLMQHLKHEIRELERSKSRIVQLHNAIDACSLSAILMGKLVVEERK